MILMLPAGPAVGQADEVQGAAPASPAGSGGTDSLRVRLRATQPGVSFFLVDSSSERGASYRHLCLGDCDLALSPGRHRFALSMGAERPVPFAEPIRVERATLLEGAFSSSRESRDRGWAILGIGGTFGMLVGITGVPMILDGQTEIGIPFVVSGALVALASTVIAGRLIRSDDSVALWGRPLAAP